MVFANPTYLYLLLLLIPMIGWYIWKLCKNQASLQVSSSEGIRCSGSNFMESIPETCPFHFKDGSSSVLVVLARPQSTNSWQNTSTEGIDIVLAMDISTSMMAQDLKPNRLEASKDVAASFINGRPNDNIGLVVFAAESFTQCPLTTDHTVLLNLFKDIQAGYNPGWNCHRPGVGECGQAVLKTVRPNRKVIILLTDGVNNAGEIAPVTAAEIAKTFGIRVYSIGVGTQGMAPYPFQTAFGVQYQDIPVEIDEATLKQVAATTGGQYFRATDNASLKEIYSEIDKMEKTKISVQEYSKKQEEYKNWAILLFFALAFGRDIIEKYIVKKYTVNIKGLCFVLHIRTFYTCSSCFPYWLHSMCMQSS